MPMAAFWQSTVLPLSLFVGNVTGGNGYLDATGASARFQNPTGISVDVSGNLYVSDDSPQGGATVIRKITSGGVVTTFAGTPSLYGIVDGTGSGASFNGPNGIGVDGSGNVFVADVYNQTIRKITPVGVVSTFAGTAGSGGSTDGTGAAARFNQPNGAAVDGSGNAYVADTVNHTIRKITPAGVVTTLAGSAGSSGVADGTGAAARFNGPQGIAVASGTLYVADSGNFTIRKITPAGVVTTLAGTAGSYGSADGTGAAAQFTRPGGLAVDASSVVYVADTNANTIRKITSAGVVTTLAGTAGAVGSADATGAAARFSGPSGVTVDASNHLYVADTYNHVIRMVATLTGVVTTPIGTANVVGSADGTGAAARFNSPSTSVAIDGAGNVYVADSNNHTIRKATPAGVVTTFAGTAGTSGSTDATGAAARFNNPAGIAVDASNNVYVVDKFNCTVRKITSAGVVTTLAGTAGSCGNSDGTGAAARFGYANGLAIDASGNLYVADTNDMTIRKITPAGVVTTLAGTAGSYGSADGTGAAARFGYPYGIASTAAGTVYVADTHNFTIRKITPGGVVTTLAGTAASQGSADGTGAAARFDFPKALALNQAGILFVADSGNNTIRRLTPAGYVKTIIGLPPLGYVNLGTLPTHLARPVGIAISAGTMYITTVGGIVTSPAP